MVRRDRRANGVVVDLDVRAALDLPHTAHLAECIAAAGRSAARTHQLEAQFRCLCQLLQVHSPDALVPSVRRLLPRPY